jgi:TonB family protein
MKTLTLYSSSKDFPGGRKGGLYLLLCAVAFFLTAAPAGSREPAPAPAALELTKPGDPATPRTSADRTGSWPTSEGLTLRVTTDLGSVKIISLEATATPVVQYSVHIETDARASLARHLLDRYSLTAKATPAGVEIAGTLPPRRTRSANSSAQFWVRFEVTVPLNYNVEVKTEAGDIETQDIGGFANLATQGGNIRTGRIGISRLHNASSERPVAKLETEGGHIQVLDVAGDLTAFTAGGHINARNISGDASLRSGGGHIRAGQIGGRADLQTDGGNITVGQAGNLVSVRTGGGQIDFGEVRGSVRAQTGGGGIRIMYVSGPMEVESSAGSICLTRVAGTVRAATAGGTITAWINPDASSSSGGTVRLPGLSQLTSGNGDIVVFLPRNLAADIDAIVESGGERRIEADPALALTIQNQGSGPVHAMAALNGGGAPLKLRTSAGKIRLQFLDSEIALRQTLIHEQRERLSDRLNGVQVPVGFDNSATSRLPELAPAPDDHTDWIDRWLNTLETTFLGGLHEDPDEFQKHLVSAPAPSYPQIARRAGVQGIVRLQVHATKDGRVEVDKIIDGSPTLADAAICAVKLWRVRPFSYSGRPVEVTSTLTFNFQLH